MRLILQRGVQVTCLDLLLSLAEAPIPMLQHPALNSYACNPDQPKTFQQSPGIMTPVNSGFVVVPAASTNLQQAPAIPNQSQGKVLFRCYCNTEYLGISLKKKVLWILMALFLQNVSLTLALFYALLTSVLKLICWYESHDWYKSNRFQDARWKRKCVHDFTRFLIY